MSSSMISYVAMTVLGCVFCGTLVSLVVICKMRCQRRKSIDITDECSLYDGGINSIASIDEFNDPQAEARIAANMQLHEFSGKNTNLDRLLQDEEWVEEMTSLAPFCLQILKTCHALTTKLKTMTVDQANEVSKKNIKYTI